MAAFRADKLLVRMMEDPDPVIKASLQMWARESVLIKDDSLDFASCTLIVPDIGTRLYSYGGRTCGLMFDAAEACTIRHISPIDANWAGEGADPALARGKISMDSLDDLAAHMRSSGDLQINEVKADVRPASMVGIIVRPPREGNSHKLQALLAQSIVRNQTGIELPLFMYEGLWSGQGGRGPAPEGGLVNWTPEKWEVAYLFSSAIRQSSDPDERKILEQAAVRAGLERSGNRWVMPGGT